METCKKIYQTSNYKKFKTLLGNREVPKSKTIKLVKSIKTNGYIFNPISVNEKFEIIDGQGRFSALKELGLPIDYYIIPDASIKECIVLNLNTQNWNQLDFIKSFAEQGNINYQRFLCLLKVNPEVRIISFCNSLFGGSADNYQAIINGKTIIPEKSYDKIMSCLQFLNTLEPYCKNIEGRAHEIRKAIVFAYSLKETDTNRLYDQIVKNYSSIKPIATTVHAMREITAVYNKRARSNFIYFDAEYDTYCRNLRAKEQQRYKEKLKEGS